MNSNYYSITPLDAYIKSNQITYDDLEFKYLPCKIAGITLYDKEALTFLVKLEGGECFRYIPITALYWREPTGQQYDMNELIYHNNKSDQAKVNELESLQGDCACYIMQRKQWIAGEYVLSVDYYKNERMLNLIKLANGQFALLPFHKIKFDNINKISKSFDKFKKQTEKYIVGDR